MALGSASRPDGVAASKIGWTELFLFVAFAAVVIYLARKPRVSVWREERQAAPTLATAIEDQLGLRLQPSKGQAEVLFVDRIEPPTPN